MPSEIISEDKRSRLILLRSILLRMACELEDRAPWQNSFKWPSMNRPQEKSRTTTSLSPAAKLVVSCYEIKESWVCPYHYCCESDCKPSLSTEDLLINYRCQQSTSTTTMILCGYPHPNPVRKVFVGYPYPAEK